MTQRTSARRRRAARRGLALLTGVVLLAGHPDAARAEDPGLAREGGFGFAAALASLGYGPLKLAYAVSGLALGLGSYVWTWGDQESAMTVVAMSIGGDYVVTPAHLGGADDLRFTGDPRKD